MAKSSAQILADYAKQGVLSQMATAAGDIANIAVSGATGGLFNRGIAKLTGASDEQVADFEHAQRVRAGLAGDVANVGGMVLGLKGAGGVVNSVRSAPVALAAGRSAGLGQGLRV